MSYVRQARSSAGMHSLWQTAWGVRGGWFTLTAAVDTRQKQPEGSRGDRPLCWKRAPQSSSLRKCFQVTEESCTPGVQRCLGSLKSWVSNLIPKRKGGVLWTEWCPPPLNLYVEAPNPISDSTWRSGL